MSDFGSGYAGARSAHRHWYEKRSYPWIRLLTCLGLGSIGSAGMYVVAVVLPEVQTQFGTARMGASLPYTLTMIGFGAGSILMGPLSDRFRIFLPVLLGAVCLAVGFVAASQSDSVLAFSLASLVIGVGSSATFAPLVADISLWFQRRRGIAVSIVACGNYVAGAIWPPLTQHMIEVQGWRFAYAAIGIFSLVAIFALSWLLRPVAPGIAGTVLTPEDRAAMPASGTSPERTIGISPGVLQVLLCISGISCCVAMSMPQVHIVALCADLGYGSTRGAEMLSLMLTCGIVSRLTFGWISDHIGGAATLLLSGSLQAIALGLFLPNQSLDILFVVSGLFGLFQGGIVPSYAMIVREFFPAEQAGARVSLVFTATMIGMAIGGWMSGWIFDLTSSYDAAFMNGIAWNMITIAVALTLVIRGRRRFGAIPV